MPNQIYLPIIDTIKSAWNKISGAKGSFWAAYLITILIFIPFAIAQALAKHHPGLSIVIVTIQQVVVFLFAAGLIYMGIERAAGRPINYKFIFYPFRWNLTLKLIGNYLFLILIFLAIFILGMLVGFLVLALTHLNWLFDIIIVITSLFSIYFTIRLSLSVPFILDKNVGVIEAYYLSYKATQGNVLNLIGIWVLALIIFLISIIPLGIGLIWTIPFMYILLGEIYRILVPNIATSRTP